MITTGSTISFGPYEWRILELKGSSALLLSEEILEQRDYHDKKEEVSWEASEIRRYLNGDFLSGFREGAREKIIPVLLENNGNPWYGSPGGARTEDKIFLLSIDEIVRSYFGDSGALLDNPKPNQRYWFERKDKNNERRRAAFMNSSWWWWTRSPGKNNKVAAYVHGDGNVGMQGNGVSKTSFNTLHPQTQSNKGGVRPAMWISSRP